MFTDETCELHSMFAMDLKVYDSSNKIPKETNTNILTVGSKKNSRN